MDRFAIIRSLYGCPDQHASDLCLSDYPIGPGGGIKVGQVIGSTNRLGEVPQDRPVHYQDVFATLYHQLGIDVKTETIPDHTGRPQYMLDRLEPVRELI